MDRNSRLPLKEDGVEIHDLGTEFILHDTVNKRVHVLNKTAFYIWDNCDGTTTAAQLIDRMRGRYNNAPEQSLIKDVETALEHLRQEQMVAD